MWIFAGSLDEAKDGTSSGCLADSGVNENRDNKRPAENQGGFVGIGGFPYNRRTLPIAETPTVERLGLPPRFTRPRLVARKWRVAAVHPSATETWESLPRPAVGLALRSASHDTIDVGFGAGGGETRSCANYWQKDQSGFHDAILAPFNRPTTLGAARRESA
jgi:hypothetical protein